jgi:hypothetical protein
MLADNNSTNFDVNGDLIDAEEKVVAGGPCDCCEDDCDCGDCENCGGESKDEDLLIVEDSAMYGTAVSSDDDADYSKDL